ncbi:MAG: hypothetical protein DRI26_00160 [Chloroflexi bacterium]|nr:MAG: hypothetical protein DRI26_00160 [Chloroflexota bacterium]
MSVDLERPPISPFLALVAMLLIAYIFLTVQGYESAARPLGELISITVIAIVSYYLGWSRRQYLHALSDDNFARNCGHLCVRYIARLGYIVLGFGLGLLIEHAVTAGIDLSLRELLLGHEWIGLYCIVIGMVLIGYAKRLGYYLRAALRIPQ